MKFIAGVIIGILLCLVLAGVGGYYFLQQLKDLQFGQPAVSAPVAAEDASTNQLRAALNAFNRASNTGDMLKSLDEIISLRPGEPEAYAAKAAIFMQQGDYNNAVYNYNKAISLNPSSADLYMNRAAALLMLGDYASANKDLTAALSINPSLGEAYYNRGISNINLARINPAIADFTQAQKFFASSGDRANYTQAVQALNLLKRQGINPGKNPVAAKAKIAKAAQQLKPSTSITDAKEAAKFKSELSRSLSDISSSIKNGDKKSMLQKFKQASAGLNSGEVDMGDFNSFAAAASKKASAQSSSGGKNILDYTSDAKNKMAQGDYEGAIADYDKAIASSSNPSDLYAQRAAANIQNNNYQGAYKDYSKAIEADKNNAMAYLNRARLRASMGDNKGAAQDAVAAEELYKQQGNDDGAVQAKNISNLAQGKGEQTITKRDNIAEALFKEASNAYAGGNYQESLNKFNDLAKRQPNVPEVFYNRAIANMALGNKEAALQDYQKTIAMNPNLPDAHIGAASILMEKGKSEEASKEIETALKLNPEIPSAYRMRGAQSLQKGDAAKAAKDFSRAIELDNKDGASYFSRGISYAQQGDFNQAREDSSAANALAAEQGNQALLDEVAKYQGMLEQAAKQQ